MIDDKVLVKQLQREVARLEASLRTPSSEPIVEETTEALLQAKEEQIQQVSPESSYNISILSFIGKKCAVYFRGPSQ